MLSFLEFVLFNEGVNKQLAAAQLGKKWRTMDQVPDDEVQKRLNNSSQNPQLNIDHQIQMIAEADPTTNKAYFAWILAQHVAERIRLPEDSHILHQDLNAFTQAKNSGVLKRLAPQLKTRLQLTGKQNPLDITTLDRRTLNNVVDAVHQLTDGDLSSNRKKAQIVKQDGARSIWKDAEWEIIEVEKGAAACYYAKGTRWCTSSERMADHYLKDGPLYIVFEEGKPFCQIHFQSEQAMDPQDNPIKNIPDPIIGAFIEKLDLDDDSKTFLYRHADRDGEYWGEYIEVLEKQFDEAKQKYKWRNGVSVDANFDEFHGEEGYINMDASVYFNFSREQFIKAPEDLNHDYSMQRTIEKNLSIHSDGSMYVWEGRGEVHISFTIREEEDYAKDDLDRWKRFLSTVDSNYNEEDDYNEKRHELYLALVQNGFMKSKLGGDEEEMGEEEHNDNFHWLKLDTDDFNRYGTLMYESKPVAICSAKQAGLDPEKFTKKGGYAPRPFLDNIDTTPIVEAIEGFLRQKSMAQLKHHQSQGVLPFIHKPRLPPGFVNVRRAPKVNVMLTWDYAMGEDDGVIKMKIRLQAHLHDHSEKVLKSFNEKVKYLDKRFMGAVDAARQAFLKMAPTIFAPTDSSDRSE
jgi:hypothetical protein